MKTFMVEKGTIVTLGNSKGELKVIAFEDDMKFEICDMIYEPARTYNRNMKQIVSRNFKFKFNKDNFEYVIVKYSDMEYINY